MSSWVSHFTNACEEARRQAVDEKKDTSTNSSRVLVVGQHSACCAATVVALLKSHPHCSVRAFVQLDQKVRGIINSLTHTTSLEMMHLDCDDQRTLDEALEDIDTLVIEFPLPRLLETALAWIAAAKRARLRLMCVVAPPVSPTAPTFATQFLHLERNLKNSGIK
jgi:hypothetical protein